MIQATTVIISEDRPNQRERRHTREGEIKRSVIIIIDERKDGEKKMSTGLQLLTDGLAALATLAGFLG